MFNYSITGTYFLQQHWYPYRTYNMQQNWHRYITKTL
jgi:hypothetical protein